VAIESRIDIIVKNLNKLNDVSKSLQQIQKSNEELVKGLNRLEKKLNSVEKQGSGVFSSMSQDASVAAKNVGKVSRAFDRFNLFGGKGLGGKAGGGGGFLTGMLGGGMAVGGGLGLGVKATVDKISEVSNGFSSLAANIPGIGQGLSGLAQSFSSSIQPTTAFEKALYGVGDQLMAHPQWYGAAAVALMAFAGPLKSVAVSGLGKLGNALKQNKKDLNTFKAATVEAARGMDVLVRGASLRELNQYVSTAKKEMESFWHMTGRAEKAAGELAIALRRQGLEQRAINDLLLKAQGKATSFEQYQNKQALGEQKAASLEADKVWRARAKEYEIAQKLEVARKKELQDMGRIGARARKRAATRRKEMNSRFRENLMLGAGFPMLFGGGLGGVGGGIAGAIAQKGGKGFGAQILLSAIGTQIDQFVGKISELGQAFNKFTPNVNAIVEAMAVGGTALGQQIEAYVKVADKTDALSEASRQMARIIGAEGVQGLKEWGEATTKWKNDFDRAILGIQATLARFAVWVANRFNLLDRDGGLGGRTRTTTKAGTDKIMNNLQQKIESIVDAPFDRDKGVTVDGQTFENKTEAINYIMGLKQERQKVLDLENAGLLVQKTVNQITKDQLQDLTEQRQVLEDTLQGGTTHAEIEKRMRAITKEVLGDNKELTAVQKTQIENQRVKVTEAVKEEERLRAQLELWDQIKNTIASGLTNAITGLIEGTKTLGEALAGILKQIGQILMQKALTSMLGNISFGGGGVTTGSVSDLPKVATAAQGAYFMNGIKPFSTGGITTKPTLGLIGEAGESEYIIPASKMASSMQRYSAGARGEAVIPSTGSSYAGGGGSSTTVNYSGPILNFNSEEFVPKSAVGQIIATATARGASVGESRTISSLRNSRSRRSSLGL